MVPLDEPEVLHRAESAHDRDGALLHLVGVCDVEVLERQSVRVGLQHNVHTHRKRLQEERQENTVGAYKQQNQSRRWAWRTPDSCHGVQHPALCSFVSSW